MRALKGLVIVLAVLIVIAMVAVMWAIFNLVGPEDSRPVATLPPETEALEEISLELPAGCEIASAELDRSRLAIHTTGSTGGDDCDRVYIVDLSRGEVVSIVTR